MAFSGWVAASASLFAFPYLVWMVYTGLFPRYRYSVLAVVLYVLADAYYNVCWNADSQYCPTGSSDSPVAAQVLSDLTTFFALTALCPLIDEWWLSRLQTKHKDTISATFYLLYSALTFVLVVHFGHDLPTAITLPSVMAVAVIYAYIHEMMAKEHVRDWFMMLRFWLGVCMIASGVVLQSLGNSKEFDSTLTLQTDAFNQYMFGARAFYGLGLFVAITCIGTVPNIRNYIGLPMKLPSGPNASPAKKLVTYTNA